MLVSITFYPLQVRPMARITSATSAATLFLFLATLISHVLTLPLLQWDGVNQLKVDLELFTGDLTSLDQAMYIGPANSGHQWLALSVSDLRPLK